ncbi:putative IMV protein VP55 [Parapoxvirus red deer/HL953]|uniref:Putative IMV protein VP55 n=1 Tax=Parapoxvirus red deer/HL953 TaxID=1579460 RepID=A0A0A7M9R6_9POXV|nr:putative IMV protein VP55 [Parapoxvirus red deer/HL953]AIZ77310.1 putative IMV protein VP55 [Parapoxvirus red deer/HL953]
MDTPSPEVITVYVINVAGRTTREVFPTLPYLHGYGLGGDPPKPTPGPAPTPAPKPAPTPAPSPAPAPAPAPKPAPSPTPAPKPTPPAPHPQGDHVFHVIGWSDVKSKDYEHYFSDLCRSSCPQETQHRVAHNLNLWEYLSSDGNTSLKDDQVIMVVSDDMTVKRPEVVRPLIEAMKTNGWGMLQLRETYISSVVATAIPGSGDPELMVYPGGFDVSLDAYLINVGDMKRLYAAIVEDGGVRSSMLTEVSAIEHRLGIERMVLAGADKVVYPEYYLQVRKRLSGAKCMWSLVGSWLAKYWPGAIYFMTTPLFSFAGAFDVTVVDLFILAFLLVMLVLLPHSRFLWFLAGMLFTAVV